MSCPPLKIFCSYAHEDEVIMQQLRAHLASLRKTEQIEDWYDPDIPPGSDWDMKIKEQLNAADIILLLISPDFINSGYCMEVETALALQRIKEGRVTVIPIFARECVVDRLPFAHLQGTPKDHCWITQQDSRDKAYSEVVRFISVAVEGYKKPVKPAATGNDGVSVNSLKNKFVCFALLLGLGVAIFASYRYFVPVRSYAWNSLLLEGEYQLARESCLTELENKPGLQPAQDCITITGLMLDDIPVEKFNAQAKVFLANHPESPYVLAIMAEVAAAKEDWVNAEKYYHRALKREVKLVQAYYGLGQIYQLQKLPMKALIFYQTAVFLAPHNRRYRHNLASIYSEHGNYQLAGEQFYALLKIDRALVIGYVEWINVLLLQGDFSKAFNLSERLLSQILPLPETWQQPLNKAEWFFNTDKQPVYVENQLEKENYIKLQYALCAFLAKKTELAETMLHTFQDKSIDGKVAHIFEYDMQRLKQLYPQQRMTIEKISLMPQ